MDIPYGRSNFDDIRRRGSFYADKTVFLPALEEGTTGYPIFLRPRRFGKSTLLSMLGHYYDIGKKDSFDALFKGLWVHENPTPERNSYLILKLDFSAVITDAGPEVLRRSFFDVIKNAVIDLIPAYSAIVPLLSRLEERTRSIEDVSSIFGALVSFMPGSGHKLYVLIDEYDHFANRLLVKGAEDVYESSIGGFVRAFYATLKTGTQTGAVGRIFITGVSPLMLDDMSSGFNIATNISMVSRFNALAGFTLQDTERAVDALLASRPDLHTIPELSNRASLLDSLEKHYNGYRFSPRSSARVFNADMVLYFLQTVAEEGAYPKDMLDLNVRTEYRHLQRVGGLSGTALAERRVLLQTIVSEGHIRSEITGRFGISSLLRRAPFVSLLYYLGMLTLGPAPRDIFGHDLEIPNRVIRELQWEHLAHMLEEQKLVTVDVEELQEALGSMAIDGDIQPFLGVFHTHVLKAMSNRDTRGLDEKTIKLLLMTYASLGRAFFPLSEKEFAQGYTDLFLGPTKNVLGAKYSWLLELKYLKTGAKPAHIEAAFAEAQAQVERYANDAALLPMLLGERALKAGALVFVGVKKVLFQPWPPEALKAPRSPQTPRPPKAPSRSPKSPKPRAPGPKRASRARAVKR